MSGKDGLELVMVTPDIEERYGVPCSLPSYNPETARAQAIQVE